MMIMQLIYKMKYNLDDSQIDAIKKRIPLPTSIQYDPVRASKYRTRRDYLYNEDPVYRRAVRERYNKQYNETKEDKYIFEVTCDKCDRIIFTCEKMKLKDENNEPFTLCSNCKEIKK